MPSNKKYYWLKLHEEFFNQTVMKYIRKLPDGDTITIIYLKLLLKSLKTEGYIYFQGFFPTIEEEIALDLGEELVAVQFSLAALEKVQLLERGSGDSKLCMTKLPEMVGSETVAAARMRNLREKRAIGAEEMAALPDKGNNVTSCSPDVTGCYPNVPKRYLEIEKDKEIEQDRESETEIEAEKTGPKIYGVNQNVILSDSEYESLKRLYPDYLAKIDYFSSYLINTGKHYDNHYFTIMQWAKQDDLKRPQPKKKKGFPDYSFKEGESL